MVNPISKKVDELAAQIKVHKAEIEKLEDKYSIQRRKIDEAYFDLEDFKRDLERFYEERYDEASYFFPPSRRL